MWASTRDTYLITKSNLLQNLGGMLDVWNMECEAPPLVGPQFDLNN